MAKQRQVRIEQGLPQNLMEEMQERTDEQLESESKHRSIALALLGARAAERYDAAAARTYFRRAIAASRPQERIQIRRMADASLALAERRPDDLKQAVERLGQAPPSGRALMGLRLMGLIAPSPGASILLRIRGFAIIAAIVLTALAIGLGVVELIWLPFGGIGIAPGILLGLIVVGIALAVLAFFGRRRQAAARAGGKTASPTGRGAAGAKAGSPTGKGAAGAKAGSTTAKGAAGGRTGKGATGGAAAGKGATGSRTGGATGGRTATGKSNAAAKAATNGQARRGGQARASGAAKPAAPTKTAATGKPDAPAKPATGKSGPPAKGPQGAARRKRPSR